MEKEIFKELEGKGEYVDMGYEFENYFFVIRRDKYLETKRKFTEPDYTGY